MMMRLLIRSASVPGCVKLMSWEERRVRRVIVLDHAAVGTRWSCAFSDSDSGLSDKFGSSNVGHVLLDSDRGKD